MARLSDGSAKVQAAALADALGATGETNVQGEVVQFLDTFASDTFVDVLSQSGRVAAVGSEEIEDTVVVGDSPQHHYIVQMDPLDGSSNIDVAVSIGSIFGIWKRGADEAVTDSSLLRLGREQVAAMWYGSCTTMVLPPEAVCRVLPWSPPNKHFALPIRIFKFPKLVL